MSDERPTNPFPPSIREKFFDILLPKVTSAKSEYTLRKYDSIHSFWMTRIRNRKGVIRQNPSLDDPVLKRVQKKTLKSRDQMVKQYNKSHEIDVFAVKDIVTLRLPGGSGGVRTSTDSRRLFCSIRSVPHEHRYELQTKFGVLDRLVPTRELKRVPRLLADSEEIEALLNGPSKKVSMKKIGEMASTSDRVLISCRCKGKCASRRCRCFKKGRGDQFIVMSMQSMIAVS
jgi:hypothetical protein